MTRNIKPILPFLAALLLSTLPAQAQELDRESSLIQRMGKAAQERRERAGKPPTLEEVKAAAKIIDDYHEAGYRQHRLRPNALAGDETFLRRAYLDVAGRIPTAQETLDFLNDKARDKNARLIDRLLNSEAYVHHNYTFLADLLRVQTEGGTGLYGGIAYANWIKDSLRQNKPYDKLVYELLTATGYPWESGAVGFYLRDEGMPLDHMATTVQVFLGTSLQCAQCHDHPFDKWSQYEFYEMAAFTAGVNTRNAPANVREAFQRARDDQATRIALDQLVRPLNFAVTDSPRKLTLPDDYKYPDAKPGDAVDPFPIFGPEISLDQSQSIRQAYANWMIDRQNERFATTIANRLWKRTFGAGLIEPPDMMTEETQPSDPQLMAFLAHKMIAWNYDLKQFQRMLLHTKLYQRLASDEDPVEDQPYYFTGPLLRRMTAEQLWDSLVTLTIPDADFRRGPVSDGSYFRRIETLRNASPDELLSFARDEADYQQRNRELFNRIQQARAAGNNELAIRLIEQRDQLRPPAFMQAMTMSPNGSDEPTSSGLDNPYPMPRKDPTTWQGFPPGLVRASELPSPMRADHFLRQFGQSDRDLLNNASDEPHILQVLAMFNGPYFDQAISPRSHLMITVGQQDQPLDKVRAIFLSVLNREPNQYELNTIEQLVWNGTDEPDYSKIIWALLNTREFSFVR